MAAKYLYNLYDEEELVLEKATLADIREFTGLKNVKMKRYIERNGLICGIYRAEIAGEYQGKPEEEEMRNKMEIARKNIFTPQMYREWKDVCKKFQRVSWVKSGGRKLKLGDR